MKTYAARKAEGDRRRQRNALARRAIRAALKENETLSSEVVEPLLQKTQLDQDDVTWATVELAEEGELELSSLGYRLKNRERQ